MFGSVTHLIPAVNAASDPPKDVPPPTQINFPCCRHLQQEDDGDLGAASPSTPSKPLPAVLQGIVRPTEVKLVHLEALGVHVTPDVELAGLIPDPAYIPDFAAWDKLSMDDAFTANESTQKPLNTGNLSPGCQVYVERKRELSIPNEAAFRAVRRIVPPKGQSQARLGNSYEFFRHLELFSTFWDDTSKPIPPSPSPRPEDDGVAKGKGEEADDAASPSGQSKQKSSGGPAEYRFYRTGAGHQMPPEYRQNITQSFIKMVTYDFGCNVSAPRTEPRLHITSHSHAQSSQSSSLSSDPSGASAPAAETLSSSCPHPQPSSIGSRSSYFASGCTFIFRTPTTREAARAGIVEGPLAAVSARHTTSFPPRQQQSPSPPDSTPSPQLASLSLSPSLSSAAAGDRDSLMDLGRELIAALITAQHRARQGRVEKRFGENAWWATKPRWGGGPGGPIGREVEMAAGRDETVGDKDEPIAVTPPELPVAAVATTTTTATATAGTIAIDPPRRPAPFPSLASRIGMSMSMGGIGGNGNGNGSSSPTKGPTKRVKRTGGNLPMYDNYRMVRPPAATWDRRTRYATIGRAAGADYDDIFVVSVLFHHVSLLRVRVPDRLLAVLEGAVDDDADDAAGQREGEGEEASGQSERCRRRSWGRLEVRRSRWYDLFKAEDRVAAMQMIWSMMAYLMRSEEENGKNGGGNGGAEGGDVRMANA